MGSGMISIGSNPATCSSSFGAQLGLCLSRCTHKIASWQAVLWTKSSEKVLEMICFQNFSVVIGEPNGVIGARVGVALVPLHPFFVHWNGLLDIQNATTPGDSRRTLALRGRLSCSCQWQAFTFRLTLFDVPSQSPSLGVKSPFLIIASYERLRALNE